MVAQAFVLLRVRSQEDILGAEHDLSSFTYTVLIPFRLHPYLVSLKYCRKRSTAARDYVGELLQPLLQPLWMRCARRDEKFRCANSSLERPVVHTRNIWESLEYSSSTPIYKQQEKWAQMHPEKENPSRKP